MSDRCDLARGWLLKARSDLNACHRTLDIIGNKDRCHGFSVGGPILCRALRQAF